MEKATISQLKNRLSAYLRKVRAGQAILVLDRDEPIAVIERVQPASEPADRIARLEKAGLLRRARQPLRVGPLRQAVPRAARSVVQALLDERREGR